MKRNLLLLVAIFIAGSMSAQLYVGARVGYGFGAQKYAVGYTQTDDSRENIWGSMGQGLPMGLKLGYYFNDNLGIELGVNYWIGAEQTAADISAKSYDIGLGLPVTEFTNITTAKSSQLRILPQLVYKSDMGIYGRFGMVIPVSGKTIVSSTTEFKLPVSGTPMKIEKETQYKGTFAIGFAGAFGYAYELSDNMHLFGEMEYISLTIKGKTSEITKSSTDGKDQLPSMDTYDKQTNYVDELNSSSNNGAYNNNPDMTKAQDELRTSTVYSSLRFNVGITMAF